MNVINYAYLHLVLVHVPVIGLVFSVLLLFASLAMKSEELRKVTLGFLIIIALMTVPVYFTGEPAEELVEDLPGVSESIIDQHEDSGFAALMAVELLGLMALGGLLLFRRPKSIPGWFMTTVLILSIGGGGLMMRTAKLGGEIRHTEIRSASTALTAGDEVRKQEHERREKEKEED